MSVELTGTDSMTARFLTLRFLVIAMLFGSLVSAVAAAQTPAVQTPATIFYGSIAPVDNSTLSTSTSSASTSANTIFANTAQPAPIFLAQNTTPAPITPITPTPPPAFPNPSPPVLPPFDPFAAQSRPPAFSSIFPIGTTPSPSGPSHYTNIYSGNFDRFVPETYAAMRRFREATSFEFTHLPRGGKGNGFGMAEIDIRMQLAFPCRFVPNNGNPGYFYVAPGASLVWWDGPNTPDMPPNAFGSFLDFGVQPRFNDTFGLNAWGRFGVFSDFNNVTSAAFRYQARLEGIYSVTPQMDFHLGVIYYGRARIKLLPTAGVVWRPDENWVVRAVFPNPKVSRRIWQNQQADWWGYVHMDYMGGSWDVSGRNGLTDYNDIRLGVGIDFVAPNLVGGYFEFGGSFARELYSEGKRQTNLPSVLYLKTGIIF